MKIFDNDKYNQLAKNKTVNIKPMPLDNYFGGDELNMCLPSKEVALEIPFNPFMQKGEENKQSIENEEQAVELECKHSPY